MSLQGTKKSYRKPVFRGNSSRDYPDILHPQFDDCSVPLVWWPWWPFNPGDFFLSSLAPFHAMLGEDVIDRNIRYMPVLDGLTSPGYFQWYFDPITHHKVSSAPGTWLSAWGNSRESFACLTRDASWGVFAWKRLTCHWQLSIWRMPNHCIPAAQAPIRRAQCGDF